MKAGRRSWVTKITTTMRQRLDDAIRAGRAFDDIYLSFDLSRYCTRRAFREYLGGVRRDWEIRSAAGETEQRSTPSDVDTLIDTAVASMQMSLDAQKLPDKKLPEVLMSLAAIKRLDFSREVNRRAEEKHEALMAKIKPAVNQAIERITDNGAKPATREEIMREIGKALRSDETKEDAAA